MIEYEKTFNLFQRHKDKPHIGKYDESKLWAPEMALPRWWYVTEKIDGMNLRVIVRNDLSEGAEEPILVYGRSDAADVPGGLKQYVEANFKRHELIGEELGTYVFFGEGYGAGIQKVGSKYRSDKAFIGFDVYYIPALSVGGYYLPIKRAKELTLKCGFEWVPERGQASILSDVVDIAKEGGRSRIGDDAEMEGVVAIAPGLFYYEAGDLRRLKFKLKTKDFVR